MGPDGGAAGVYHDVAGLEETFFFEEIYLVCYDRIHAYFFVVIECLYTPAKAELVYEGMCFGKYIDGWMRPEAGQHKACIAGLGHADECICIYVFGDPAGVITKCITEEWRGVWLRA